MALVIDPARNEVRALEQVAQWRGKRVLELGCGSGRLTLRLAQLGAAQIDALDPDTKLIDTARKNLPKRYAHRIAYRAGEAERVGHLATSFDLVVFSWAL